MIPRDPRSNGDAFVSIAFAILGVLFVFVPIKMLQRNRTSIKMDKASLTIPTAVFASFVQDRRMFWKDLTFAGITNGGQYLILQFADGTKHKITLAKLTSAGTEQLLLAIDAWAPQCTRSESLLSLREKFQSYDADAPSFTQLWESELGRRFSLSTFIPLEPGTKLRNGTISIERQSSFGGFSAVYICHWRGRKTVLKELSIPDSIDTVSKGKAIELFEREAQILASLDHPSVVKIIDHFQENGRSYIVMEHAAGLTLRQLARTEGARSESTTAQIGLALLDILSYFHEHDPVIIHRDITPDNIIVDSSSGNIKLVDFGASNTFLGTATGTVIGKTSYMPPEQVRGKPTPATDIYGLGCTLFFLLSGRDPEPLTQASIKTERSDASDQMHQLLKDMTELEYRNRPTYTEIKERLNALAGEALPISTATSLKESIVIVGEDQ